MACTTSDGLCRPFQIAIRVVFALGVGALLSCNPTANTVGSKASPVQQAGDLTGRRIDIAAAEVQPDDARNVDIARPACPFPQHFTYRSAILPNHRSREQLDADVIAAYEDWKADYLVPVDAAGRWPSLYRVTFGQGDPGRSVSEGIGYGMLLTVSMAGHDPDARRYFDGLWRFARLHPSHVDARLMAWQVPTPDRGDAAAFDGDADMALALLMADAQWGSDGDIDYRQAAATVVEALYESAIGPDSRLPMLGDWVDPYGERHNQYTPRSSDLMPATFRVFSNRVSKEKWEPVHEATLELVTQMQSQHPTGLLPDFIEGSSGPDGGFRPARARFLEGPHDGDYHYNAGRVPLRLGMEALREGGAALEQLRKIAAFVERRLTAAGVRGIGAGFTLEGEPYGDYFTTFFAAPFAVALMSDPQYQGWLNALYDTIHSRREGYYEDSINLLSLLLLSGNFWLPGDACQS